MKYIPGTQFKTIGQIKGAIKRFFLPLQIYTIYNIQRKNDKFMYEFLDPSGNKFVIEFENAVQADAAIDYLTGNQPL